MQQDNSAVRMLTYRELILTLQRLCKEKRTGVMFINDGSENSAKLVLEQGAIFDVAYKGVSGTAALALIKEIKQGKASFSNRLGQTNATQQIGLSTAEIFQFLVANLQKEAAAPAPEPSVTPVQPAPAPAPQAEFLATAATQQPSVTIAPLDLSGNKAKPQPLIAAQLAAIIGPVAHIVYQTYAGEILAANDFKALNAAIEKISKQVLDDEQQKLFRQNILAFINQQNLKSHEAILAALKATDKSIKLTLSTLSLLVCKHAAQADLGQTLLNKIVSHIEQAGNVGSAIALIDVLRLLEKSSRTGLLEVRAQEKKGGFYFDKGVLINAVETGMNGKLIAMDLLQWSHDYIVFRGIPQQGVSRQISQTVDLLISELERLTGVVLKSKIPHHTKADEITLTAKAIHQVESCDGAIAEQTLVPILLSYADNFKGWLWLSRILTNMTAIEIALKMAVHINSRSAELADEVKKFTVARKLITEEFVLRCPFCWAPNSFEKTECLHCKSEFFISPDFFKTGGKAKMDELDKAIERFNNALQQEPNAQNIYLRFYLAMAYLNRKYYQEGLDQFTEIGRLVPHNQALAAQANLLKDYMKSAGLLTEITPALTPSHISGFAGQTSAKILVVEDSMVTRKVIVRALNAAGYETFEAKNAYEALLDIEARNPNLVLLDIVLPGKDGYEILAEIRQKPMFAKLPVIMLTSRDSLFDKLKGKVSEANEYLTKPFQPDELLAVVHKYLK